jgi:hypothetical protein
MNDRPDIPQPLKRLVRQECNFGCAICGLPIFDYDHITPYSEVLEHKLDNLILLCPNHHRAKGKQLDVERVKEAKLNPFNKGRKVIDGYKLEPNRTIEIKIGSNGTNKIFENGNGEYHCLWINGISFLKIHSIDNWITISMIVTDGIGQPILEVDKGELKFTADIWDYRYEGSNLQLRTGQGEILLDINLSNYQVDILRGCFLHSPHNDGFVIRDDGSLLTVTNNQVRGMAINSIYSQNGFGGLGILNKTKYPNIIKPNGFGSFRQV